MPWQPTNNVEQDRFNKLQYLLDNNIDPYPTRVKRTHTIADAIALYEATEADAGEDAQVETETVTVCGRIVRQNLRGKLYFGHIADETGRIQLFVRINVVGEDIFSMIKNGLDMGDFVEATGPVMRTKTGEISINVQDVKVLSKALSPLPVIKERVLDDGTVERYGEFSDTEERYRQRYADLAVNPDVREVFKKRTKTVRAIQSFLDGKDYLEVETPILQPIYGGAAARPFVTHHNQLHQELFLRISFELYLKRLLVGGFDGVYEIGRDFRNEGVSYKHNTEFTMLEVYVAYADYNFMMELTEQLVADAAMKVNGTTMINFQGHEINLAPPWRRVTIRDLVKEVLEIDYMEYPTQEELAGAMKEAGIEFKPDLNWGKLVEELLGLSEERLIQPTFVLDYPLEISPFAKKIDDDPTHTERFEFYIAGMEMGNAFTELNSPLQQEENFLAMGRLYDADDEDAAPVDEDYLRAMRYGMPPAGGMGMGVDRLVMLLTDRHSIREVLLYPHLRAKE